MSSHTREPIAHTCPDIDKRIKAINYIMRNDRELRNMDEKELYDVVGDMAYELCECISILEELRKSNETLRLWGIEEAERVDELEINIEQLTQQNLF